MMIGRHYSSGGWVLVLDIWFISPSCPMSCNFRGVYILRISNFCIFRVFEFAEAACSGVEIFMGEKICRYTE